MKNQVPSRKGGCFGFFVKWLLATTAIVLILLYFFAGKIVDMGVDEIADLADVKISSDTSIGFAPFHFDMRNFKIKNPEGFSDAEAISFNQVRLELSVPKNAIAFAASNPIVIDEIKIIGPSVAYEQTGLISSNNLAEIQKKLNALMPKSDKPKAEKAAGEPMRFIIKKIVFEDGTVKVKLADNSGSVRLPSFTVTNLGGDNGLTASEIAANILVNVTAQSLTSVTKDIANMGAGTVIKEAEKGNEALKGALKSILGD